MIPILRLAGLAMVAYAALVFIRRIYAVRGYSQRALPEVRDAGPQAMKDPPDSWDAVDEAIDESFPASDPPGGY
jgi:hypothetical protein